MRFTITSDVHKYSELTLYYVNNNQSIIKSVAKKKKMECAPSMIITVI